jgi:hypothetical protein
LHREIVSGFRRNDIGAIFPLQHLLSTVLQELVVTLDLDGYKDFRLRFGSGDMECNTVKVGDGLVNVDWRGTFKGMSIQPSFGRGEIDTQRSAL